MNLVVKREFYTSAFVYLFWFQDVTPIDQEQHHPDTGNLYFLLTFHLDFDEKFYSLLSPQDWMCDGTLPFFK